MLIGIVGISIFIYFVVIGFIIVGFFGVIVGVFFGFVVILIDVFSSNFFFNIDVIIKNLWILMQVFKDELSDIRNFLFFFGKFGIIYESNVVNMIEVLGMLFVLFFFKFFSGGVMFDGYLGVGKFCMVDLLQFLNVYWIVSGVEFIGYDFYGKRDDKNL